MHVLCTCPMPAFRLVLLYAWLGASPLHPGVVQAPGSPSIPLALSILVFSYPLPDPDKAYLFHTAYADAISLHVAYVGGQSAGFSDLEHGMLFLLLALPPGLCHLVCVAGHSAWFWLTFFSLVHAQGLEAWHLH